jgi:hypothetical protein
MGRRLRTGGRRLRFWLIGIASTIATVIAASPSEAFVYFTYGDSVGAIGRAESDGATVELDIVDRLNVGEPVTGPASDGKHLFWLNPEHNTIGRADLDGSHAKPNYIVVAAPPTAPPNSTPPGFGQLAISKEWIYFNLNGKIGRVDVDGSQLNSNLVSTSPARGLSVANDQVFWAHHSGGGGDAVSNYIGRANLDGSEADPFFIGPLDDPSVIGGLATDSDHIYWSLYRLGRANLDGSAIDRNFVDTQGIAGSALAARAGALYWPCCTNQISNGNTYIARLDLASLELTAPFVDAGGGADISGIALDGRRSPETEITERPPRRTREREVTIEFRSDQPRARFECKLDRGRFRSCRSPVRLRVTRGAHRFRARSVTVSGADPTPASIRFRVSARPRVPR